MSAYLIIETDVHDPVGYEEYKKSASATVHAHGGNYIVRCGKTEVLEGDWQPKRIVVLQFPSTEPRQRVAELRRVPRAPQDASPHGQDEYGTG